MTSAQPSRAQAALCYARHRKQVQALSSLLALTDSREKHKLNHPPKPHKPHTCCACQKMGLTVLVAGHQCPYRKPKPELPAGVAAAAAAAAAAAVAAGPDAPSLLWASSDAASSAGALTFSAAAAAAAAKTAAHVDARATAMAVAHADPPAVDLSAAGPPPELADGAEVRHAAGAPHAAELPSHAVAARVGGLDAAALRVAALEGASVMLGPAAPACGVRTGVAAAVGSQSTGALATVEVGGVAPVCGSGAGLARGGEGADGMGEQHVAHYMMMVDAEEVFAEGEDVTAMVVDDADDAEGGAYEHQDNGAYGGHTGDQYYEAAYGAGDGASLLS